MIAESPRSEENDSDTVIENDDYLDSDHEDSALDKI